MKVLIAGGAGFIGSHLCDLLLARDHSIICLDNLLTSDASNLQHLTNDERFQFFKHNIIEPFDTEEDIDYVLHLASPASPPDFHRFPIEIMRAGSQGTFNALEMARGKKARFLLASTSEVYGDPLQNPQNEEYWGNVNPIGPRSVYDEAKRFAEALTMAYHRQYGLDTRIVRIFNTYGPRMRKDDGRVVPALITQALQGEPLTVFGNGSQTRSFCYVSDLVEGIYQLMQSDVNSPVNLGNTAEVSIMELAQKIIQLTGSISTVHYKSLPQDEPRVRQPDISKANRLLGWQPEVQLVDGLVKTIEWFKAKMG
ncbi:UDP-glucuronic acid decarboxylase family protein [Bacteroidota bacterium]